MSVEIQWNGTCPDTGGRRIIQAERFARGWRFKYRNHRRDDWTRWPDVPKEVWEELLEALERRVQRNEGVTDADIRFVRQTLGNFKAPRPVAELPGLVETPPAIPPEQRDDSL